MPKEVLYSDIIAITGHRDYPDRAALLRGLDQLEAREYMFGGARGVDSDALEYIAKTQPGSIRTVVVPNRVIDQPLVARASIQNYATNVIELKNSGPDRFQIRNEYMVDHSTHVRAFYDFRGRGGTFNTINYANSQGKEISLWNMTKFDVSHFMDMPESDFREWMTVMEENHVQLSSCKFVILGYFKGKYGALPTDIAATLRHWRLTLYE